MNTIKLIETYYEIKYLIRWRLSQQQELDESECIFIYNWFSLCNEDLNINMKYENDLLADLREFSVIIPNDWIVHFIPIQTEAYWIQQSPFSNYISN